MHNHPTPPQGAEHPRFTKLTPTAVGDGAMGEYMRALDFAFKSVNSDVLGIALAGPYGSGKSSVLASYKARHNELKFVHIKLTRFTANEAAVNNTAYPSVPNSKDGVPQEQSANGVRTPSGTDGAALDDTPLVGKIINQFLQQTNPADIPLTRFKTTAEVRTGDLALGLITAGAMLFVALYGHLTALADALTCSTHPAAAIITAAASPYAHAAALATLAVLAGACAVKLVRKGALQRTLRKFTFLKADFELFSGDDDPVFDRYLNEIVYLFSRANVNAVVFEDIDRYETHEIFERLRELCFLVGEKRRALGRTPLRFLYLVRDDLFLEQDRTKFFDFIIPVLPVLDGSNSLEKLLEVFATEHELAADVAFMRRISLYIDDMRLLKNVYNEYQVFKSHLAHAPTFSPHKLLAMVLYKNFFPTDYSDTRLGLGRGALHNIFANKHMLERYLAREESETISDLNEQIALLKEERDTRYREVELKHLTLCDAAGLADDFFALPREEQLAVIEERHAAPEYYAELSLLYDMFLESDEYLRDYKKVALEYIWQIDEHIDGVNAALNRRSQYMGQNLEKLLQAANEAPELDPIKFLLQAAPEKTQTPYTELLANPYFGLIRFFLAGGHIDESYPLYMTYFYESFLAPADKQFLISLDTRRPLLYDFTLTDAKNVLSRVSPEQLKERAILNNSLLYYALSSEDHIAVNTIIKTAARLGDVNFICSFVFFHHRDVNVTHQAWTQVSKYFYTALTRNWPGVWARIAKTSGLSSELRTECILTMLSLISDETLMLLYKDPSAKEFIHAISMKPEFTKLSLAALPHSIQVRHALDILGVPNHDEQHQTT